MFDSARVAALAAAAAGMACGSGRATPPVAVRAAPPSIPRYEQGEFVRLRVTASSPIGPRAQGSVDDRAQYEQLLAAAPVAEVVVVGPETSRTPVRLVATTEDPDTGWRVEPFSTAEVTTTRLRAVGRYEAQVIVGAGLSAQLVVEPRQFDIVAGQTRSLAALPSVEVADARWGDVLVWGDGGPIVGRQGPGQVDLAWRAHAATVDHEGKAFALATSGKGGVGVVVVQAGVLRLVVLDADGTETQSIELAEAITFLGKVALVYNENAGEWAVAWTERRAAAADDKEAARKRGTFSPWVFDTVSLARVGSDGVIKSQRVGGGRLVDLTLRGTTYGVLYEPGVGEAGGPEDRDTRAVANATLAVIDGGTRTTRRVSYDPPCPSLGIVGLLLADAAEGFVVYVAWRPSALSDARASHQLDVVTWGPDDNAMVVGTIASGLGASIVALDAGRGGAASWVVWVARKQRTGRSETLAARLDSSGEIGDAYRIDDRYEEIAAVKLHDAGQVGAISIGGTDGWSLRRLDPGEPTGDTGTIVRADLLTTASTCP